MNRHHLAFACSLAMVSAFAETSASSVANDEIAALENEVSLELWQIAGAEDCAGNVIEDRWATIYSPKDPVGLAGNWNDQLGRAKALSARHPEASQRMWLDLFVRAGEAVARRDAAAFSLALREMRAVGRSVAVSADDKTGNSPKLFSANGPAPGYPKLNRPNR